MQRTMPAISLSFVLLGVVASACNFSVNPALIDDLDAAAVSESDAQFEPEPEPEPDASEAGETDAAASEGPNAAPLQDDAGPAADAQPVTPADAGPDAPPNSAPISCGADRQCKPDETCIGLECVARCSEALGCAVVELPVAAGTPWEAVNDARDTVYYLYESNTRLWKYKRGTAAPLPIPANLGSINKLLFVSDDHVYYMANTSGGVGDLYRVSTDGSSPELVAAGIASAWFTGTNAWSVAENIWWSLPMANPRLYKSPAHGALAASLVATSPGAYGWSGGSESWVVRALTGNPGEPLITDTLPALSPSRTLGSLNAARLIGADDAAVYVQTDARFVRYYEQPDQHGAITGPPTPVASYGADALEVSRWEWVYWHEETRDGHSLARAHRDYPSGDKSELLRLPADPSFRGFSALPTALVYVFQSHLFVKPTPLPCHTGAPCPAWLSCTATCN